MSTIVKSNMKTFLMIASLNCFIILPFFLILFPGSREETSNSTMGTPLILIYALSIIICISYFVRLQFNSNRIMKSSKTKYCKTIYFQNNNNIVKQFTFAAFLISGTVIIMFIAIIGTGL